MVAPCDRQNQQPNITFHNHLLPLSYKTNLSKTSIPISYTFPRARQIHHTFHSNILNPKAPSSLSPFRIRCPNPTSPRSSRHKNNVHPNQDRARVARRQCISYQSVPVQRLRVSRCRKRRKSLRHWGERSR